MKKFKGGDKVQFVGTSLIGEVLVVKGGWVTVIMHDGSTRKIRNSLVKHLDLKVPAPRGDDVVSEGVVSEGVVSEGVVSEGVVSEGVVSEGVVSEGVVDDDLVLEVSPGIYELRLGRNPTPIATPAKKPKGEAEEAKERVSRRTTETYIRPDLDRYVVDSTKKTPSGRASIDNGDTVAEVLRGKSLDEVYEIVADEMAKDGNNYHPSHMREKYRHLNHGQQRMSLGNRLRGIINKRNKQEEAETKVADLSDEGKITYALKARKGRRGVA